MKKWVWLFLLGNIFFNLNRLVAQNAVTILVEPTFGAEKLVLEKNYLLLPTDSVQVSVLRFYISKIFLLNDSNIVAVDSAAYLIDAAQPESFKITVHLPEKKSFNRVKMLLGIDSATNVDGVQGGNLDPIRGMYWAWQSGYINFKLEAKSARCRSRKNQLQWHLGGYLPPFYAAQPLDFAVNGNNFTHILRVDVQKIITQADISTQHTVMHPCAKAVLLSQKIVSCFEMPVFQKK